MGHAKEIITLDIYGDNAQIIADGVEEIQKYMKDVLPEEIGDDEELLKVEINVSEILDSLG